MGNNGKETMMNPCQNQHTDRESRTHYLEQLINADLVIKLIHALLSWFSLG